MLKHKNPSGRFKKGGGMSTPVVSPNAAVVYLPGKKKENRF